MKKRILAVAAFVLLLVAVAVSGGSAQTQRGQAGACASCHTSFAKVLPKGHSKVSGSSLSACTSCHSSSEGEAAKNPFSARVHLAHMQAGTSVECATCHLWVPDKSFGLIGGRDSHGTPSAEDMKLAKEQSSSWSKPGLLDNAHAKAMVDCAGCHGKDFPMPDSTVESDRCLQCHGPMETLAKKTEPKEFADRNPHNAHLGEIECTTCHHAHAPSQAYCLNCHPKFAMKMKYGAGDTGK